MIDPERIDERSKDFARAKLQRLEELKTIRAAREPELQEIADYICPRRDFTLTPTKGATRTRRLMGTTGMVSHERFAAVLYGYMLSPATPFTQPRLLSREPTYEEDAYFDYVSRRMHTFFASASNTFRTTMAEDVLDITGFGSSVLWQDKTPQGSKYLAVPFRQCYWDQNEWGEIDTNYRVYEMSLRRAALKWRDSPALAKRMENSQSPEHEMVEVLHLVEPRVGGVRGSVREGMPWRDVNILTEAMEVLDVGGHNRFKYNIGRFKTRPGDPLGQGAMWAALPFCKLESAAFESWIRNAEKRADPALWTMLPRGTAIDRRPGQVNFFNQLMAVGMRDPRHLIQHLEEGGDTGVNTEVLRYLANRIETATYIDWLTPNEGPQKTATEVYDLRDLRLRTMGPIVARMEHEKMTGIAEQTYEDLDSLGWFGDPPASLHDEEIGFEFKGPLATAQRQGEGESILRTIEAGRGLAEIDPDVVHLFRSEPTVRKLADVYGMDGSLLSSPAEYAERREAQRELGNMQEEMQAATVASQALRDGAQGVATLQAAQGGGA